MVCRKGISPTLFMILSFSFFLCIADVAGQEKRVYNGTYTFGEIEGVADYEYLNGRKDRQIKDGSFRFKFFHSDTLGRNEYVRVEANGRYRNDMKTGTWRYTEGRHRVEVSDISYFNVKTNLASEQKEISAAYSDSGFPDGSWEYKIVSFADEQVTEMIRSNDLEFRNGNLAGPITFQANENSYYLGLQSIKGYATANGLMDGLWHFNYVRDTLLIDEYRFYKRGFLTEITKLGAESGDTLFHILYDATISKLKILESSNTELFKVSDRDFGIYYTDGFDQQDKKHLTQVHGNSFLNELLDDLIKYDGELYYSDQEQMRFPLKTKRFEFQLLPVEDSLTNEIGAKYPALKERVHELLIFNTFTLNYQLSDSLFYARNYLIVLDSLLGRLDEIMQRAGSTDYKYFDARSYENQTSFDFMESDSLKYKYQDREVIIQYDFNEDLDRSAGLLSRLNHYLDLMASTTDDLASTIDFQLAQVEIGNELQALQIDILARKTEILQGYIAHVTSNEKERTFFKRLTEQFFVVRYDEFVESYGENVYEQDRLEKAKKYLDLINILDEYQNSFKLMFTNQTQLDSLYMEEVFNPFTYSSYDRRIKEPIWNSASILFNTYLSQILDATDAEQIGSRVIKIQNLHKRMEKLRYQETRTIERRMRSRMDPNEIETALEI